MLRDLRHAARITARRPGAAAVVIAVLALGIGANTAIFSVVNGLIIRQLPYPEPERLALVWETLERDGQLVRMGPGDLLQYRARSQTVETMAALTDLADAVLTGEGQPQLLYAFDASPSLFSMLGAHALMGRLFDASEESPGSNPVVVLGYDFWRNGIGANSSILGRTLCFVRSASFLRVSAAQ